jgi:hypothetical protein
MSTLPPGVKHEPPIEPSCAHYGKSRVLYVIHDAPNKRVLAYRTNAHNLNPFGNVTESKIAWCYSWAGRKWVSEGLAVIPTSEDDDSFFDSLTAELCRLWELG